MFEFRLKYHWNLFPRVQLTIFQLGSDNGLAPTRRQAIIWTNDGYITDIYMRHSASMSYSKLHCASKILNKVLLLIPLTNFPSNSDLEADSLLQCCPLKRRYPDVWKISDAVNRNCTIGKCQYWNGITKIFQGFRKKMMMTIYILFCNPQYEWKHPQVELRDSGDHLQSSCVGILCPRLNIFALCQQVISDLVTHVLG